jgi:(R,R)-butanediol dehydrogenase/meso-butanediol dehydrogenase/diacetyl reductase
VVIGGGPIGLLTAMVARVAGARAVFLVEPQPFRKQMATSLGFPEAGSTCGPDGRPWY